MSRYKELKVYQKGYALALSMYKFTKTLPNEERFEMASQIRRAASSVPMNIAEGYAKEESPKETARFLRMAKGSAGEMEVLMDMCKDLAYLTKEQHKRYQEEVTEIQKMLHGLIETLKTTTD